MTTNLPLGCIADDFTGATDLANNLVRAGMRVVQTIGVPEGPAPEADAVVVALKSRTIPAAEAVAQSLAALHWLRSHGARQFYFKVCSTFDSTPQGNIGPVAEALLEALGSSFCCVTPAFPENARTVYKGHLFVGDVLLSDSGMRNHPLTPMTDPNLVRVMQAQSQGKVGLIEHRVVRGGAAPIHARLRQLQDEGYRFAIVDALDNEDLMHLGRAIADMPLVVAGSGVAIGLPQNHGLAPSAAAAALPPAHGATAIVSGSCSQATNAQVADFLRRGLPALAVDPLQIASGRDVVGEALAWAEPRLGDQPVLVYSSAPPESVRSVQQQLGVGNAGEMVEKALAAIAKGLVDRGVRQLVVAGGETSGAAVQALGVQQMRIGPQIDPGVPWCHAEAQACGRTVHLALKSGNFGTTDFFTKAFGQLG
ncbi:four-carbon acid sugar kinase family protein [Ramlibacter sp. USB13]|uniref:3-oxo-tetronate kinase n=1 Tax=Ramlibacter cellulosilyticus TaxID=2764187 RepID=A0A923MST7_9BURK|nr:3-oxo-tetronate kinase [Ramlibacter cellulosilyticus]MBC5783172.1 four-carbon acid sugar kinase family protein [Ramlibacter cellulosilyticus]